MPRCGHCGWQFNTRTNEGQDYGCPRCRWWDKDDERRFTQEEWDDITQALGFEPDAAKEKPNA